MIVVDIDTSDPQFKNLKIPAGQWVIWNADGIAHELEGGKKKASIGSTMFEVQPPLGGVEGRVPGPTERFALAVAQMDDRGSIREYLRTYDVLIQGKNEQQPPSRSLYISPAYAVKQIYDQENGTSYTNSSDGWDGPLQKLSDSENVLTFVQSYQVPSYPMREILKDQAEDAEKWKKMALFKGQVVVLGGTYRAARDVDFTAYGKALAGCEVVGNQIEAELRNTSLAAKAKVRIAWSIGLCGLVLLLVRSVLRRRVRRLEAERNSRAMILKSLALELAFFLLVAIGATSLCNWELHGTFGQGVLLLPTVLLALYLEIYGFIEILIGLRELAVGLLNFIFWAKPSCSI